MKQYSNLASVYDLLNDEYDYNKYGLDKQLHKSSFQRATPYQLILHNQRYYLMAYSGYWGNMVFHRLDKISNMSVYDQPAKKLREIDGYKSGIDYKKISSAMPYMYTDEPKNIEFIAHRGIVDQIIDWFGKDIRVEEMMNERDIPTIIMKEGGASEQQLHGEQYADNDYAYITAFHSNYSVYRSKLLFVYR